jgi:hypothetical protein
MPLAIYWTKASPLALQLKDEIFGVIVEQPLVTMMLLKWAHSW